ncbi:hypothetical protein [uncultured Draconibacterium sp.]|uniref:hypothetical protein n=1 Tax=uncultured Draconibacterium sp. TaxID=1573823 RepID=UPI0025CD2C04|nr:hypothetical protein [uncultured Draconibacterium sp.]
MKKTLTNLIVTAAFIIISAVVMAQGGEAPYVGSAHDYSVTPGNGSNGLSWQVDGAETGTGFMINSGQTESTVNITWMQAGTYMLTVTETDANSCSTTKQLEVNVSSAFEVSITGPEMACNSAADTANAANNITSVDYVIKMTTGVSTWSPNWEVAFTVSGGTGSPSIEDVNVSGVSLTDTGGGSYSLTGLSSTSGNGTVTVTVDVAGDAFSLLTSVFTITSAKELQYNTTDTDGGDWGATATINPIPNTSAIQTD